MKKSILNLGRALNKADQMQISGGTTAATYCAYYRQHGLCFGPVPGCQPCGAIDGYPYARTCTLIHQSCESEGGFPTPF